MPPWFARRLTQERLEQVCRKVQADDGESLGEKMLDSIPAALFVLLPLMAFVLKVLYPLSKRYYVEHLLFVVHYHAFFFLILSLIMSFAAIAGWLSLHDAIAPIIVVAASLYIPVYLYKALRRVYGQGHLAIQKAHLEGGSRMRRNANNDTMLAIKPEDVFAACDQLLAQRNDSQAA